MSVTKSLPAIESIEVFNNITSYDGYKINTNQGPVNIKIDNNQQCCEDISTFVTFNGELIPDNKLEEFLHGKLIQNIILVDENTTKYRDYKHKIKITITLVGLFDNEYCIKDVVFTLENDHNGYYDHDWFVNWDFPNNANEFKGFC
jgi:hypothetical protein